MVILIAIIAGLVLGSFLSVLLERWPTKKGIVMGRSECPHCHHVLAWYDLIPLFSWLSLGGRCRYCRSRISITYPLLEVAMAGVFAIYAWQYGLATLWALTDYIILFGLVSLLFFDLRWRILPDIFIFTLIAVTVARDIGLRPDLIINGVVTAATLAVGFGFLYLISRGRWIGLGDVKMGLLVGLVFGYQGAIGVTLIAIWAGALVGVVLILMKRATMQTAIPFGSFWAAAAILAIIWPSPVYFLSGLLIPVIR